MVIELIGGIGAGKSRVLALLKDGYGAEVIQTDLVAKELEKKGNPGYAAIVDAFGSRLTADGGELDPAKLSELIFRDGEALERINRLIHPLVWAEVYRRVRRFREGEAKLWEGEAGYRETEAECRETEAEYREGEAGFRESEAEYRETKADSGGEPLLVVETALPEDREKTGDIYDEVWYVYSLEETRTGRLMACRGYSREKCLAVMGRQPSDQEYRALADRVIDNNGDAEALRRQIEGIQKRNRIGI